MSSLDLTPDLPPAPVGGETPAAWLYKGDPYFDGTRWHVNWCATTDERLARYKAQPDKPVPLFRRSTPEAAPEATDEELWSLWAKNPALPNSATAAIRACYNLGRQHGAGAAQPAQPAPPVAPVSDSKMTAYNQRAAARFAILDRLEEAIDFSSYGWRLTPEGELWQQLVAEQGQDECYMGL